ncbi:MAG: PHP domain-containing protein [Candidatus Lokiarchaeota archaeon]|nr:PHP domain-containing protein [Candidatus Lokiarchaeota archaeon]MBD3339313.1 PHP domain-containing protein [Candidatus Lokiarchaeota archaeon]
MTSLKLDLHLHTIYSGDSLITPKEAVSFAKKKGLDGIAITDHNTLKALEIAKKENNSSELMIIPGMEIETNIGEILALFISEEISLKDNRFFSVIEDVKEKNGLVVIPHPFDFLRSNHLKMSIVEEFSNLKRYIDGIEIINSRIILKYCVKRAIEFNERYDFFETGGSDAHTKEEIGNGYTLVNGISDKSQENVKRSLLSKKSESCGNLSSPFVHLKTVLNKIKKGLYFT